MALTQAQIDGAQAIQHAAAHDTRRQVRVVAGPGTGKSSTIEERVRWLLDQPVQPGSMYVVSFTRASALDLRQRVYAYGMKHGFASVTKVRVTTLHALALRTLRAAGLLTGYPADPLVLSDWELENVFDAEFGDATGIGKERREMIRLEHEAFWSTDQWDPPNYVPPDPPISAAERAGFNAFHGPATQSYSCVLPGEIVRQCVSHMSAGTLNATALLHLEHLIVDEYQDLNPMDLRFVNLMATEGAHVFVAGDDDQSVYSFRFASPAGIQNFAMTYPECGKHTLADCFRCSPGVLVPAQHLIAANSQPQRIPKTLISLYAASAPPVAGAVHRVRFTSGVAEARAIAASCDALIASGVNPRDILVLLSNQRTLLPMLRTELERAAVPFESPHAATFLSARPGRLIFAVIRIVCDGDDYVAHRVLLGMPPGIGVATCGAVRAAVIANNLNYRSTFYQPLPSGVFAGRPLRTLNNARAICSELQGWRSADTVGQREADIAEMVARVLGTGAADTWCDYTTSLPKNMTLEEMRDYLWADTDEQQAALLQRVLERLDLPVPEGGMLPPRVRVMTMHGAKGLSAKVVFIPGVEEEIIPGPWRQPYPGLVLEAARLLYVSITRARAACIISYAETRVVNGRFSRRTPSRFAAHLGGQFSTRTEGLSSAEVENITRDIMSL